MNKAFIFHSALFIVVLRNKGCQWGHFDRTGYVVPLVLPYGFLRELVYSSVTIQIP